MASRLPYLARTSLLSSPFRKSPPSSMRRSLTSISLSKSRSAYRRPRGTPTPRRQGDKDTSLTDTSLAGTYWTKQLHIGKVDDSSVNPGHTLFTSPGATKAAVIDRLKLLEVPSDSGNAVVIFASPRHASWLTDSDFMAKFMQTLLERRSDARKQSIPKQAINVLTAVVDGLYPQHGYRGMQEGLSLQFGSLDCLLPGLWDEAPTDAATIHTQYAEPGFESAHVSVSLRTSAYQRETCTVTLPLANTLFHNGRRTTLLASEWVFDPSGNQHMNLLRMVEKRIQEIDLPMPSTTSHKELHKIRMRCPLVPITHPRKIVEGLGNILAKVEINGELSPASKELQVNIPLLLQARQSQSDYDPKSARIGVWALVLPESLFLDHRHQKTSLESPREPSLRYNPTLRMDRLGTAVDMLAFEMEHAGDRTAWQRTNIMRDILLQGGRLHQILSGGGEWGAKASLLSLDPQTTYGVESEEDELDRFQRSFHGEDTVEGATTRPGDFVQFFVEGDPTIRPKSDAPPTSTQAITASYPFRAFGVGEFSKEDYAPESLDSSIQHQKGLIQLAPFHFGAFSAEGLYLDMKRGHGTKGTIISTTTKINTPGTTIQPIPSGASGLVDPPRTPRRVAS
ncbi:hypothetical protein N0V93_001179 [Gnomoniopsis smithogilvyi]|uniref:Uncharacterized protein n=1 Tax=Gnomoniopsis smithogilvyi TaxID=1191159 RepID=A0A9W8Z155_9PEZI|nr:hypothetical protein N0V93_001179 [Gnomoniopsis smithogilvyi]